jgi:hypothetical protein
MIGEPESARSLEHAKLRANRPGSASPALPFVRRLKPIVLVRFAPSLCCTVLLCTSFYTAFHAAMANAADTYGIHYHAEFQPKDGIAAASITVEQDVPALLRLDFYAPEEHAFEFEGDGQVTRNGDRVLWRVPATGGTLAYNVRVDRQRGPRFDSRMTANFVMMRLDDLFPPARAVTEVFNESRPKLSLAGPKGWSYETRYGSVDETIKVSRGDRRFVRPTGWLAAGKLSVRRDRIAGRRVVITGPIDERLRSLDFMALLQWNLPELVHLLPHFPKHLLIVNAGDPMWRGGLSGPGSLYLHSARPLISGDGSSAPLHELVHVGTANEAEPGNDWIVEGLAEFYSIEAMRRSGTISESRYDMTLDGVAARAKKDGGRLRSPSTGAHTSRAVTMFRALNEELKAAKVKGGLDAVATPLLDGPPLSRARMVYLTEKALGEPSKVLADAFDEYLDKSP